MLQQKQLKLFSAIALFATIAVAIPMGLWAEDRTAEPGPRFVVPTPAGFKVLYMFTGARDTTPLATNSAATVVHCTNFDTANSATVIVEFADFDNIPSVSTAAIIIPLQQTRTFATQDTAFYAEDALTAPITDAIDQGSVRVLVQGSFKKLICMAVVLDPVNNPPTYTHTLPAFTAVGKF